MTPPDELRSPAEERTRQALRSLERPEADPTFRERLRREFIAGTLAPGPRRAEAAGSVVALPRRRWRGWQIAAACGAAAAAVIALVTLNRAPGWELMSATGEGIVIVDRIPVPLGHAEDLSRRLRPGATLRLAAGSEVVVALPGQLAIQITPATTVTLPGAPGRWFGRHARGALEAGEVRITTGPGFRGARLALETPEAFVELTGTTLAVIREPEGTCVCVYEGKVAVGAKDESPEEVPSGTRRFVFQDGRPPERAEIRPAEIGMLRRFRARGQEMLGN
jgi:ferric-dicitrate binding protein FerR (iron transport regulator)